MQVVTDFSDEIYKEFRTDNCAKIVFKKGKFFHTQNLILDFNGQRKELEQG
jgi:hypothetical protein